MAPARHRRAIEHQPMLEKLLAAEVLVIGVLDPAFAQRLIRQVIGVLEDGQPGHQSGRQRRMAGIIRVDLPEATFQEAPIHRPRQRDQWMLQVDDLIEPGAKQILFTRLPSFPWPHVAPRKSFLSERITNQICKESPSAKQFPGKLDFHNAPFLDSKSRTWEFFTDDYFSRLSPHGTTRCSKLNTNTFKQSRRTIQRGSSSLSC